MRDGYGAAEGGNSIITSMLGWQYNSHVSMSSQKQTVLAPGLCLSWHTPVDIPGLRSFEERIAVMGNVACIALRLS